MLRGARTKKIVLPQPPKEADDDGSQGRHRSAKNGTSLTASNKGGIVGITVSGLLERIVNRSYLRRVKADDAEGVGGRHPKSLT